MLPHVSKPSQSPMPISAVRQAGVLVAVVLLVIRWVVLQVR
jgi:hypothetical protein